jgi:hypothetical protein
MRTLAIFSAALAYRTILVRLAPLADRLSGIRGTGRHVHPPGQSACCGAGDGSGCGPAGALALARVSVLAAGLEGRAC